MQNGHRHYKNRKYKAKKNQSLVSQANFFKNQ